MLHMESITLLVLTLAVVTIVSFSVFSFSAVIGLKNKTGDGKMMGTQEFSKTNLKIQGQITGMAKFCSPKEEAQSIL